MDKRNETCLKIWKRYTFTHNTSQLLISNLYYVLSLSQRFRKINKDTFVVKSTKCNVLFSFY